MVLHKCCYCGSSFLKCGQHFFLKCWYNLIVWIKHPAMLFLFKRGCLVYFSVLFGGFCLFLVLWFWGWLLFFFLFLVFCSLCLCAWEYWKNLKDIFSFSDISELIRLNSPLDVNTKKNTKYLSENVAKVWSQMLRF